MPSACYRKEAIRRTSPGRSQPVGAEREGPAQREGEVGAFAAAALSQALRRTLLLASVRTADEAERAIAGGADIVDLKESAEGALGRLPDDTIAAIRCTVAGRRPTSATIGDLPLAPAPVLQAVRAMAATGVDIVKLGIFPGDAAATVAALGAASRDGIRLVAVLFADRAPDFSLVARCADAGFYGVMLDTADKAAGPLTRHVAERALAHFIAEARRHRLLAGLAGSLSARAVPRLLPLQPDYLGFRSALTTGERDAPLDRDAVARLRALLDAYPQPAGRASHSTATATAGAASVIREAVSPSCARTSRSKPR